MWLPTVQLSNDEVIAEFDQWVTPSLTKLRESEKFLSQIEALDGVVAGLVHAASTTWDVVDAVGGAVQDALVEGSGAETRIAAVFATLSLVTGQSDNAAKCQYPIWRRRAGEKLYPRVTRGKVARSLVPNVVKQVDLARDVVALWRVDPAEALALAESYAAFLLSDAEDKTLLEVLVRSYAAAEAHTPNGGRLLLAPLVAFQVRGSVAASGGHGPEAIARDYLAEWGLFALDGFNTTDVVAANLADWLEQQGDTIVVPDAPGRALVADDAEDAKTRAFDFVLPNRSIDWPVRLFVQSQFYAGDSGSVSHKNVDQAGVARTGAAQLFPGARFIELVDGAGYCASLRKDLRHLLFAADTHDFVQLRSIPIRLRRALQQAGVFTPLDVALQVADGATDFESLRSSLAAVSDVARADRAIEAATAAGWIAQLGDGSFVITTAKESVIRRYSQLDSWVVRGRSLSDDEIPGALLLPGFGPNWGVPSADVEVAAAESSWVELGVVEVGS